jgi:hypothetical protein
MRTFLLFFFILTLPFKSYSHGGGLNKSGCHNNKKTGNYHCHKSSGNSNISKNSKFYSSEIKLNEDYFNKWLANQLGGQTEVTFNYNYNLKDSTPLYASIRVDIVTDEYVIEGGLDKRSSLDSIQQAVFASTIAGKKPAVAIYDTNGIWGKYEHRIWSATKKLGVKFFWVSGKKIQELF